MYLSKIGTPNYIAHIYLNNYFFSSDGTGYAYREKTIGIFIYYLL